MTIKERNYSRRKLLMLTDGFTLRATKSNREEKRNRQRTG